jgi:phage-related tail fiber protein
LGAKNLKQYSSTGSKVAPVIANGFNTDIVFDSTDFVILDQLPAVAISEAGKVIFFAGSNAPSGYLKANGNAIPNGVGTVQGITADFSTLYGILGTKYGVLGTLPDMRGQFARGFDDARGLDTGRVLGSAQTDAFQAHTHSQQNDGPQYGGAVTGVVGYYPGTSGGATGSTGGTETRPTNIALLVCIKY